MTRALVSLSGGLDSTTLLAYALHEGREVRAVSFVYGSKHNSYENVAASRIALHYKVKLHYLRVSEVFASFRSDLLTGNGEIPEGHYEADSMRRTVVPARNMIFASVLAGLAQSEEFGEVWLGVHAGDHHIYPDCRPGFISAMQGAVMAATEGQVALMTPFLFWRKDEILRYGLGMDSPPPYELTRTCYADQETACGCCGACQERLESYHLCGREDPLTYASRTFFAKT